MEKSLLILILMMKVFLWISEILCVPNVDNLREEILEEAHYAAYNVHPSSTKMYHNIKDIYWWDGMKKDIAKFIF